MSDTSNLNTIAETSSVGSTTFVFENGTGVGQVNAGVTVTGNLPSGGTLAIDFSGINKTILGGNVPYQFSRHVASTYPNGSGPSVREILITNKYNGISGTGTDYLAYHQLPFFTIKATGTAGFSGLFGGQTTTYAFGDGSGNLPVFPNSSWGFTNIRGASAFADTHDSYPNQHMLYLEDSGSGVPFEMVVVGVTGNGRGN
tara:strand:- start:25971 stop:26570 length:600 start_codon:yes stop_codon:yes gene_type:complete